MSSPFAPIHLIGGQYSGEPFYTCGWNTGQPVLVVKGLDVWYNTSRLRAIRVTYSDGSRSAVFGKIDDSHGSIVLDPGERVTSLTLWGNGVGTRCGRIRLTTEKGKILDVGKDTSGQDSFDIDVGAGILVGMMGRSGLDVDQLGAIFLRSAIARVTLSNIVYSPPIAGSSEGISAVALDRVTYNNNTDKQMTWDFTGSTTRTMSRTYTSASSHMFGVDVGVKVTGDVFVLKAEASTTVKWQYQSTETTATTVSSSQSLTWKSTGTLQPGETVVCTAVTNRGEARVDYTAKVELVLGDGTTNKYTETGVFQNIAYTDVSTTAEKLTAPVVSEAAFIREPKFE